ncbi:drug/metabolite transporter (DMT)-like permease [Pedobacter cryoconitis]|uniref:Drug/metabolite transporter (DMT)-like permease n=1 Tax=Pedobacter cryoconitis TaxID=188932 RepID=A0A7W8ZPQ5_9SPHI|nr:DMT family transporter [Pedobacter cryoconitis]MBB5637753.1 drug/metabolite transporter (DMT)-like permease [Pedobacter cryoconitis]
MKKSYIQLHIAVLLAGFTGLFGRLINLNEGLISWYRLLISGLVMWIYLSVTGKKQNLPLKERFRIGSIGFILGIHWIFFYGSIKYSNISVGVVCFALTSFFNAILAPLINKKRLSFQEIALSSLTLCGIALIFGMDASFRLGIVLGIISAIFSALYTIFNERLVQEYESNTIILNQMIGGCLGLTFILPVFLLFSPAAYLVPSMNDFGWLVVLSVFCTVLMYFLITSALKKISSFTVSLTYNLEPLYTIALAIIVYKENKVLSTGFYIGLSFILISLGLQMYRVKAKNSEPVLL